MKKIRIAARLDVKGYNVIKGIQMECLRVVGTPAELAEKYYLQGADEIIYMDVVASLYGRQNLLDIVDRASEKIFIPITVGGGIKTISDIRKLLNVGADKVAINTAATFNPKLIRESSMIFGAQCIVSSIEAKKVYDGKWEVYTNNGREKTGFDAIEWARTVEDMGAGEILVTSIDSEGIRNGFDIDLLNEMSKVISIPITASGGAGDLKHISRCIVDGNADAVAIASVLHYNILTIKEIKSYLSKQKISVRNT